MVGLSGRAEVTSVPYWLITRLTSGFSSSARSLAESVGSNPDGGSGVFAPEYDH